MSNLIQNPSFIQEQGNINNQSEGIKKVGDPIGKLIPELSPILPPINILALGVYKKQLPCG